MRRRDPRCVRGAARSILHGWAANTRPHVDESQADERKKPQRSEDIKKPHRPMAALKEVYRAYVGDPRFPG
jgi:hypothetical protein